MSEHALKTFLDAAKQDSALVEGAQQALGDRRGEAASGALAAYARDRGYDVTDGDVAAAMTAGVPDSTLSDSQLDGVAGGGASIFGISFGKDSGISFGKVGGISW